MYSLYMLTNTTNGKRYVGITNNVANRMRQHRDARGGCRAIHSAIRKYGWAAFVVTVCSTGLTLSEANAAETEWICGCETLTPSGYNLTTGGDVREDSAETLERKRSVARLRAAQPGYGAMISAAKRAAFALPGATVNMGNSRRGVKASPETIAKLRESHLGKVTPMAVRQRMAEVQRARVMAGKHNAKLTADDVVEVRRLLAGGMTKRVVAAHFGVSATMIGYIASGRQWSHVGAGDSAC